MPQFFALLFLVLFLFLDQLLFHLFDANLLGASTLLQLPLLVDLLSERVAQAHPLQQLLPQHLIALFLLLQVLRGEEV